MKNRSLSIYWVILAFSCLQCSSLTHVEAPAIYLGQGMMVGEVTDNTAILQARLTVSDTLVDGYLSGKNGLLKFVVGLDSTWREITLETPWLEADSTNDHLAKIKIEGLLPNQRYYYRAFYGIDKLNLKESSLGQFRTNPGPDIAAPVSFVAVTGMNYYHFHFGKYDPELRYRGPDKPLGYPALVAIADSEPDYFIGTGDNVYFDHPSVRDFRRSIDRGNSPLPGYFDGKEVTDEAGMRRKYHLQFVQPRFKELFSRVGTYWEKDDHDYRFNDSDPYMDFDISHELGIKNFKEQLPVTDPLEPDAVTYRTIRLSKDAQIWLVEGRDYRSANGDPDGPEKTIWGDRQKAWLKSTLLESDATFKFLVSPTPMVGPDDAYKKDNHTNPQGFRYEGDAFFTWLTENNFLEKNFYLICGDRHWQYHALHPSGFEEFSTGALVDANSRAGRLAGDQNSTDPDGKIKQFYVQGTRDQASGGFLKVDVLPQDDGARALFTFYDESGTVLYQHEKIAK